MAIKEIEQNTDYLSDDIARLEDEKASLEQAIDAMFAAVQELEREFMISSPISKTDAVFLLI